MKNSLALIQVGNGPNSRGMKPIHLYQTNPIITTVRTKIDQCRWKIPYNWFKSTAPRAQPETLAIHLYQTNRIIATVPGKIGQCRWKIHWHWFKSGTVPAPGEWKQSDNNHRARQNWPMMMKDPLALIQVHSSRSPTGNPTNPPLSNQSDNNHSTRQNWPMKMKDP